MGNKQASRPSSAPVSLVLAKDLIGRSHEIEMLYIALADQGEHASEQTVGIWGPDGSGKSALALQVGKQLAEVYPDGLIYLDLADSHLRPMSADEALDRLWFALAPESGRCTDASERRTRIRSLLSSQRMLLILDNAASTAQILALLPPQGSAALVTARQALELPTAYSLTLDPLFAEDARALLTRLAPQLGSAAHPLAEMCGGQPLALHLTGSALAAHRDLAPDDYLARLSAARAQAPLVEAVLNVNLALEPGERQAQWRTLALLHGFDAPAAAAAWDVQPEAAAGILAEFLARGLVEPSPAPSEGVRYQLHKMLRAHALAPIADRPHIRDRLRIAAHYVEVLRTAAALCAQEGEPLREGLALLGLEWDNLHDGQSWAAQALAQDALAGRLCSAYADAGGRCLDWRAPFKTQIRWLYDALRAARKWDKPAAQVRHLGQLAAAYECEGKIEQAIVHYQQALRVARQNNDRPSQSEYLGHLGTLYSAQDDHERAFGYFQQAYSVAHALGNREGESNWLGNMGSAYSALGEVEQALRCHRRALAIARERGDRRSESIWLGNLANSHVALGEPRRAIRAYRQALDLARENRDLGQQETLWGNLGNAYMAQGETHDALVAYESAVKIARELGDRGGEGIWLLNKSLVLDRQGRRREAIACAEAALEALRTVESTDVEAAEALLERWRP